MATSSFLNLLVFLAGTILYYVTLHPVRTLQMTSEEMRSKKMTSLAIYVVGILLTQFVVNTSILSSTCGGALKDNLGTAAVYTVGPWVFLFGLLVAVIQVFPSFKSVFADVIGYYYVSSGVTALFSELFLPRAVQTSLETVEDPTTKKQLTDAADLIVKMMGSPSLLINVITPDTFETYWKTLTPLMKPGASTEENKARLFSLVQTRDTVGEAMWFVYTGVLMTALVQLRLTTASCAKTAQALSDSEAAYQAEAAQTQQSTQARTSQVYSLN